VSVAPDRLGCGIIAESAGKHAAISLKLPISRIIDFTTICRGMVMPDQLLAECSQASDKGADFATIWRDILRIHPLIDGPAIEKAEAGRVWLEIPLTTGQRLVYHREDGFSLLSRVAIALRDRGPGWRSVSTASARLAAQPADHPGVRRAVP
jgi:hypothetical protein